MPSSQEVLSVTPEEWVGTISDEMRSPLSAIIGSAEMALNPGLTASEEAHCLRTILRNSQELKLLIENLYELTRLGSVEKPLSTERCEFIRLLDESLVEAQILASRDDKKISFFHETPVPRIIFTNPQRYRQVLKQLLAIAGRENQNPELKIAVGAYTIDDRNSKIFLSIIGMVKNDSNNTEPSSSFRLGLNLAKGLASPIGGDITFDQFGGTFRLGLSITSPVTALAEQVENLKLDDFQESVLTRSQARPQLKGRHILLVEDSLDNQALFSHFLSHAGGHVDVCGKGWEALKMAWAKPYDLILMDLELPDLSGLEVTRRLRSQQYRKPIMALTAHVSTKDREACLSAGCNDYLVKPIDPELLISSALRITPDSH